MKDSQSDVLVTIQEKVDITKKSLKEDPGRISGWACRSIKGVTRRTEMMQEKI